MSEQSSSDQIAQGDVCVLVGLVMYPEFNGTEITITGPAELCAAREPRSGTVRIDWHYPASDGFVYRRANLRKKRPPREDLQLVRWDQCPWQPEHVNG